MTAEDGSKSADLDIEKTRAYQRDVPDFALAARLTKAFLTVIRGSNHDLGRHVVVEEAVEIGRSTEVDFSLQDLDMSRKHARVERASDGTCTLADLGSTNGTLLNGETLTHPRPLKSGDRILLGTTVLRFALADDIELGYQMEVAQIVGEDPLTGLESKRRFDAAADFAFEFARLRGQPLSMLMIDMDGVKRINDTHGHLFGAHAIGETGRIIARHLGPGAHACRFGGDEFCAFFPGLDRSEAGLVAEKIREAVENAALEKDGVTLQATISIGVASYPEDGDSAEGLLAQADAALYRAKAGGRNCVRT